MFRRALLSLFPALLALAVPLGTPGVSAGGLETIAATTTTESAARSPVVYGHLGEDAPDASLKQRTDGDDAPDQVVRLYSEVVWPEVARKAALPCTADIIPASHRSGAARPRAPPTA